MRILQKLDESCNDTSKAPSLVHNVVVDIERRVQATAALHVALDDINHDDGGASNLNGDDDDMDDDDDDDGDDDDDDDDDDGLPLTQEEQALIRNEARFNQVLAKR